MADPTFLTLNSYGEQVAALQAYLTRLGYSIPNEELKVPNVFGPGTQNALMNFQRKYNLHPSGVYDEATQVILNKKIEILSTNQHLVEGHIYFDNGLPASNITLKLYHIGFGGTSECLGETLTLTNDHNDQGYYSFRYSIQDSPDKPDKPDKQINLEIRGLAPSHNGGDPKEIPLSVIKYKAEPYEVINLVAPTEQFRQAAEVNSEYKDLTDGLSKQVPQLSDLRNAEEKKERRDLTLLHQSTGWDARLIALTAIAEQKKAEIDKIDPKANIDLPPEVLYALFRVGLPSDLDKLALVSVEIIETALKKARDAGIVYLTVRQLADAKEKFGKFLAAKRPTLRALGALSSFGELLDRSILQPNRGDTRQQAAKKAAERAAFEKAYFNDQGDTSDLWTRAKDQGVSDETINHLQLQGKLAYLTFNNAVLTEILQTVVDSPEHLSRLVGFGTNADNDFYKADTWNHRLQDLAGDDDKREKALKALIPPAYEGNLDFYTADMARRVRLSFPTQVVARMVETQELSLPDSPPDLTKSVVTFLHQAAAQGFQLGYIPVETFIQEHAAFQNVDPALIDRVNLLHRLYQITPSNEALQALLSHELTSAHEVTAFSYDHFMELVGPAFRSAEEATLTYRKAQQVQHTISDVTLLARQLQSNIPLMPISGGVDQAQREKDALLKKFPTLESLFGSMDFCECEHCQSVLSPAAYFVDLLHFLDPKAGVESQSWTKFIAGWRRTHLNNPYPFSDESAWDAFLDQHLESWKKKDSSLTTELLKEQKKAYDQAFPQNKPGTKWGTFIAAWQKDFPGTPDPETEKTPYEILNLRRPDLSYLPLTCENTHTVLPYIDVVNEILEFYVAYDALTQDAAHDTGAATTAELLAEPQNIEARAYDKLKDNETRYPLTLPFDLWLETVRQFLNQFKTPLWQVLDTFRPTDQLFDAAKSYDRAAIFRESLGLSPDEHTIFADTDPKWDKLYGYQNSGEATTTLDSAKTLARRLDVSYKDLVKIVLTSFVNPELDALSIIWKLRLDVSDVWRYLENKGQMENKGQPDYQAEKQAFESRLAQLLQETSSSLTQADILGYFEEQLKNKGVFRRALVLRDEALTQCDFAKTHLEFADSQNNPVPEIVFLKINLFVRLWKKLGWAMDDLDRALQVFLPIPSKNLQGNNIGIAFKTALVYLAHLQTLNEALKVGKDSRQKLLTLWADLPTTGQKPLYAQLFLTRSVLKNDAIFDHPLGNYLQYFDKRRNTFQPFHWDVQQLQENPEEGFVSLKKHLVAVQGALNLTIREIYSILADANLDLETAALNLTTVSLLYRYGLLAKALKLSIRELINLKQLSGLNPFKPISNASLQNLEMDDYPYTQTLRFVEIAQAVKASGFKVEDLTYLFQHRFDSVGKYRPDTKAFNALLETLKTGIQKIQTDYPMPTDPALITDEMLREKLSLVLSSKEVDTFFGFWNDTLEFSAELENVLENQKLSPSIYNTGHLRVSYNKDLKLQRVTHQGVLTGDINQYLTDTLKIQNPDARIVGLLQTIAKSALDQRQSFFDTCFKKQGQQLLSYNDLFGGAALTLAPAAKRQVLANAFWPFLIQQLTTQLITQTLATTLSAEPALVQALLTKPQLLHDLLQPQTPLLEIFSAVGQTGAKANFFSTADATGNPQQTRIVPAITTTVKPLDVQSARFEGYLQVPVGGNYQLIAVCEQPGIAVKLEFDHLKQQPVIQATALRKGAELSGTVSDLEAKKTYRYTLEVKNLSEKSNLTLRIQHAQLPQGAQAQILLQPRDPEAVIQGVDRAYKLLAKTVQILQGLSLSQREIGHFSNYKGDFNDFDLSQLPTDPLDLTNQQAKELAQKLFGQWLRLVDYARLKRDLSEDTDDLIKILEIAQQIKTSADASQTTSFIQAFAQAITDLTRRDKSLVQTTTEVLGFFQKIAQPQEHYQLGNLEFVNEKGLKRLWKALQIIENLGISAEAIQQCTQIISPQAQAEHFKIARDLRNMVKARYEPENWQRIAQPIFDKLRQRQRDALVAHILHKKGFDRIEQLFEYFLIDPGMEPVVQTSRIRLAISSVQTFIQRCLLSLEPQVHPSAIDSKQWQWMKRYRVWEANRKIFLYPENWLEPEFRDDKTHLFQELESALLQGDVSNELAETAFFTYLKKLEDIARLEIITFCCEGSGDQETLHVIGRTYSQPHQYFYRRYSTEWTPWEPVTAAIEGDHVVAAIWQERLHLFWVTFLEEAGKPTPDSSTASPVGSTSLNNLVSDLSNIPVPKKIKLQLNWSEYFQGEWTNQMSSGFNHIGTGTEKIFDFDKDKVSIYLSKDDPSNPRERIIYLTGGVEGNKINAEYRLVSKHDIIKPESEFVSPQKNPYLDQHSKPPNIYTGKEKLEVFFRRKIGGNWSDPISSSILNKGLQPNQDYFLVFSSSPQSLLDAGINSLNSAFFYQNAHHTFFIEPEGKEADLLKWESYGQEAPKPRPTLPKKDFQRNDPLMRKGPLPVLDHSVLQIQEKFDLITNGFTLVRYGESLIAETGGLNVKELIVGDFQEDEFIIEAGVGNLIASGQAFALANQGQNLLSGSINILGGSGLNELQLSNLNRRIEQTERLSRNNLLTR